MLFSLFFALIQSKHKICVCNKVCSQLCHINSFNFTSNLTFKDFILPYIDTDKEIELNLYSKDDEFTFELDLVNFKDSQITLKNLFNSKPVNVILKNRNLFVDKILINPNNQILLPNVDIPDEKSDNQNPIFLSNNKKLLDRKYDDIYGLINVTCDRLTHIGSTSWCVNNTYGGSFLKDAGAKIRYTFNGTRIHIVSLGHSDSSCGGKVKISIDGKNCGTAQGPCDTTSPFFVTFSSDFFPFGEHTLEVEHDDTDGKAFYLSSLLLDPLPKIGGHVLGFSDIKSNDGWALMTADSLNPFCSPKRSGASFTFKFHGTRFWLTGIRDQNYGKCKLTIDGGEEVIIDGETGISMFNKGVGRAYGNKGVLLYESDVLELKDHTISITSNDGLDFCIINLLYSTQPYNAIIVPSDNILLDGSWEQKDDGCSTTENGASASITEYLSHFWAIGSKLSKPENMKVSCDNESILNISMTSEFTNEILLASINDISRGTHSVKVSKAGAESDTLHINYFYYLNEKNIKVHKKARTIKLENITLSGFDWSNENNGFYSDKEGSFVDVDPVQFSQFWIRGTVDPNYGIIDILVDDELQSSVSLYSEKHEDNIVLYESPKSISIIPHKITIKNKGSNCVCITKIQYNPFADYEKQYDEVEGLINVTCEKFEYLNDGKGWAKCNENVYAMGGSYTGDDGSKFKYTFNGTRVHVVSFDQNNDRAGGEMQISIDNKIKARVLLTEGTGGYQVVFSSDYLPFGEHTIEIEHISNQGSTFYINSLLVDPLPRVGGHLLDFNDIIEGNGWSLSNSNNTPFFSSESNGASFTFKFHGTRFWLTGIRGKDYGKCNLKIDNGEETVIDGQTGIKEFKEDASDGGITKNLKLHAYGNQGVLLYESDVLELKDHTINIMNINGGKFCIINLLYSNQPYNAIVVPSDIISFIGDWKQNEDGYSITAKYGKASITEYLNCFWVIGSENQGKKPNMNIIYNNGQKNNEEFGLIDSIFVKEVLLTSINGIARDTHLIKVEKATSGTSYLNISYFYYLNEKTITVPDDSHKISSEEMYKTKEGEWEQIDDDNIYTEQEDASVSVEFFGNKFWIYGSVDPNYGKVDIYFNDEKQSSVSLYSEKHHKNLILYESPDGVSQEEHKLKLVNHDGLPISIFQIVYQVLPSTEEFTFSQYFTNTDSFTNTGVFSGTTYFSRTDDFSQSNKFSTSNVFSGTEHFSQTDKFSRTNDFSKSKDFSRTELFSKTDIFSLSNHFSISSKFSRSSFFSRTDHFSQTGEFSRTTVFTQSDSFTQSDHFSKTSGFSSTSHFSQTQGFTHTKAFTMSNAFTPSLEPLPNFTGEVCLYESEDGNYTSDACDFDEKQRNDVIIHVICTNFTNIIEEEKCGGAVRIRNCGFEGTSVLFSKCITKGCGGGGIYIKNSFDLVHNLMLNDLIFRECQALYGGGIYIYSGSEENEVRITSSKFSQNIATETERTIENHNLFGGNHIFLTSKNSFIKNCTFEKGSGHVKSSSVKIYNVFDVNVKKSLKSEEIENHIQFSNCIFEHDEGIESSISYIDTKNKSIIKLFECDFSGKVNHDSHYVDAKVASKDNENIRIISCKFEHENDHSVNIEIFKEDMIMKNVKDLENINRNGLISINFFMIVFIISLSVITIIFIILKFTKTKNELDYLTD